MVHSSLYQTIFQPAPLGNIHIYFNFSCEALKLLNLLRPASMTSPSLQAPSCPPQECSRRLLVVFALAMLRLF